MSSKHVATSKNETVSSAKLPPKEMIVTRNKSAMFKRKLRDMDRSMKKITDLLKSPTAPKKSQTNSKVKSHKIPAKRLETKTYANQTKKMNVSPKLSENKPTVQRADMKPCLKVQEKKCNNNNNEIIVNNEYYPNKAKRKIASKKIVLKPKSHFKIIGNKRKLGIPHKGIKSPPPFSKPEHSRNSTASPERMSSEWESKSPEHEVHNAVYSEWSMAEFVRMVDETQDLSDEDLIEILTCPSPVWWEDPSDSCYIEEPIFSREPYNVYSSETSSNEFCRSIFADQGNKKEALNNISNIPTIIAVKTEKNDESQSIPEGKKGDIKFLKKRKKLEYLLGNIRNNIRNKTEKPEEFLDEINENITKVIRSSDESSANSEINKNVNSNSNITKFNQALSKKYTIYKRNSESTEGDRLSDLSLNDEMLNDLQNMDIPIEFNEQKNSIETDKNINEDKCLKSLKKRSVNSPKACSSNQEIVITSLENFSQDRKTYESDTNIDVEDYLEVTKLDKNSSNESIKSLENTPKKNKESTTKRRNKKDSSKYSKKCKSKLDVVQTIVSKDSEHNTAIKAVPKNLPPLQRNPHIKIEEDLNSSQIFFKSVVDDVMVHETSSNTPCQEILDTISDTNIRFLTDEDNDESCDNEDKNKIDEQRFDCELLKKQSIADEIDDDSENASNRKLSRMLNSFFDKNALKNEITKFKLNEKKKLIKRNRRKQEYITVYKILSTETEANESLSAEISPDSENLKSKDMKIQNCQRHLKDKEVPEEEILLNDADINRNLESIDGKQKSNELNCFYKKCKNLKRRKFNKSHTRETGDTGYEMCTSKNKLNTDKNVNSTTVKTFCESCDPNAKKSIIVSNNESVKYCLKCSSIFDTEDCQFCVKKAQFNKLKSGISACQCQINSSCVASSDKSADVED